MIKSAYHYSSPVRVLLGRPSFLEFPVLGDQVFSNFALETLKNVVVMLVSCRFQTDAGASFTSVIDADAVPGKHACISARQQVQFECMCVPCSLRCLTEACVTHTCTCTHVEACVTHTCTCSHVDRRDTPSPKYLHLIRKSQTLIY